MGQIANQMLLELIQKATSHMKNKKAQKPVKAPKQKKVKAEKTENPKIEN